MESDSCKLRLLFSLFSSREDHNLLQNFWNNISIDLVSTYYRKLIVHLGLSHEHTCWLSYLSNEKIRLLIEIYHIYLLKILQGLHCINISLKVLLLGSLHIFLNPISFLLWAKDFLYILKLRFIDHIWGLPCYWLLKFLYLCLDQKVCI